MPRLNCGSLALAFLIKGIGARVVIPLGNRALDSFQVWSPGKTVVKTGVRDLSLIVLKAGDSNFFYIKWNFVQRSFGEVLDRKFHSPDLTSGGLQRPNSV